MNLSIQPNDNGNKRRVVITGLGLVSACGKGWQPYWEAVLQGKSCIRYLSESSTADSPVKFAGQVQDFNPAEFVKQRKMLKLMSREIIMALAASQLAVQDAGVSAADDDKFRYGISLGTGIINNDLDEIGIGIRNSMDEKGQFQMTKFGQDGIRSLYPLWFLKYLPNMPACHISITHGFRGPSNTVTTSSAAGTQAIGEAFHVIRRGDADVMIAGGTDSKVNAMGFSRFHLLGLLSDQKHSPDKAYRPFDERRDGLVLGEGAGLIVLEEREHALKRGARIYGEIVGYGAASDFNCDPRSAEDFNGKRLAMTRALDEASVDAKDIDFLLANGSGIPQEDIQEACAVRSVFQENTGKLKVTAVKPITGHTVYGAGGVEITAALLALYQGLIPAVVNLETPDPDCDLPFVKGKNISSDSRAFLFNSFGFGGQNASLVVMK